MGRFGAAGGGVSDVMTVMNEDDEMIPKRSLHDLTLAKCIYVLDFLAAFYLLSRPEHALRTPKAA